MWILPSDDWWMGYLAWFLLSGYVNIPTDFVSSVTASAKLKPWINKYLPIAVIYRCVFPKGVTFGSGGAKWIFWNIYMSIIYGFSMGKRILISARNSRYNRRLMANSIVKNCTNYTIGTENGYLPYICTFCVIYPEWTGFFRATELPGSRVKIIGVARRICILIYQPVKWFS